MPKDSIYSGHNHYSHLTNEEFAAVANGFKPPANAVSNTSSSDTAARSLASYPTVISSPPTFVTSLPTIVNWVTTGAVTAVKDQGNCASCYTFATTGALEDLAFIKTGKLPILSEQQILDCTNNNPLYKNSGCNGGSPASSFWWVAALGGLATNAYYPFKATPGVCNLNVPKGFTGLTGNGYTILPSRIESALITAIAKQPVAIGVEGDQPVFQLYKSGIISSSACGINVNHAALAVGYDLVSKYFLVKNSMGATWGENGYFRIGMSGDGPGACGMYLQSTIPL